MFLELIFIAGLNVYGWTFSFPQARRALEQICACSIKAELVCADRGRQWRMGSETDWQISVCCCRTEVSGVVPERSVTPSRDEGSKLHRRSYKNTGGGPLRSQSTSRQLWQFIQSSGVLREQLPAGKTLARSSSFTSHTDSFWHR